MPRLHVFYTTPISLEDYKPKDFILTIGAPKGATPTLSIIQQEQDEYYYGSYKRYTHLIGNMKTTAPDGFIIDEITHNQLLQHREAKKPLEITEEGIKILLQQAYPPSPSRRSPLLSQSFLNADQDASYLSFQACCSPPNL